MPQFTNTTGSTLTFPKKEKGWADIRPGQTENVALDEDHAQVQGALLSGALVKGKAAAVEPEPPAKNRVGKPE